jgi:AraC-like DNA-binding protein
MMIKNYFIILVLLYQSVGAQHKKFQIPDSLTTRGYDYFNGSISKNQADSVRALLYARCWIEKSKKEKNFAQLALAYKAMLYNTGKVHHMHYADSLLQAATRTNDDLSIGSAYMTKGSIHYEHKQLKKALDNYLKADEYISKTDDQYLTHKVKYGIGLTKCYLGFYNEAISLLKECVSYFEEENDRAYLNSLHALGLCYNRIGKYDFCTETNQKGIAFGRELDDMSMEPYFILSEGVNQTFEQNYSEAIKKISEVLPIIKKNKDFANESIANFYLAKSHWSLSDVEKALPLLKKVDAVFVKKKYIRPDLRETYELLIKYYINKNDKDAQLFYINRLLKVDSVLTNDYKYLSTRIIKQFDTGKLLKAKADIENSHKLVYFSIIAFLAIVVASLVYRHHANKKRYRQKYEELMNRKPAAKVLNGDFSQNGELDINPEVIKSILKNLEIFETNKKFLEKDMNLARLAELLQTNQKYTTKIIQRYRSKGTIEYVSDLKVEHVVELLKNENRYRNYTNKAVGDEAGFGSTQNFTRAFKTNTGMSPTFFIDELRKSI